MVLQEPILGFRGKVLVCQGEVLSKKHVDQLHKLIKRPGMGCLLNYTRAVWAQNSDASGDEKPACETDPYEAYSIQRIYKPGMKASGSRPDRPPSSARKIYKMVDGNMIEVQA